MAFSLTLCPPRVAMAAPLTVTRATGDAET
jgi:hypothetical protein